MRYQVKWLEGTTTRYGFYVDPTWEDPKPIPAHSFVDDAVLPIHYEIGTARLEDIRGAYPSELEQYVERQYKLAQDKSAKAVKKGYLRHRLFSILVGDGRAHYVVTRDNPKSLAVEWRGFSPERWKCSILGLGGRFPRDEIIPLIKRGKAAVEMLRRGTS